MSIVDLHVVTFDERSRTPESVDEYRFRTWCRCGWSSLWHPSKQASRRQHWSHRHELDDADGPEIEKAIKNLREAGIGFSG